MEPKDLVAILGTVAGAIVSGFWIWAAARDKGKAEIRNAEAAADKADIDARKAVSDGFKLFIQELQAERAEMLKIIKEQGVFIQSQGETIKSQTVKIEGLEFEVRRLTRHVVSLEHIVRANQLEPPLLAND